MSKEDMQNQVQYFMLDRLDVMRDAESERILYLCKARIRFALSLALRLELLMYNNVDFWMLLCNRQKISGLSV